MNVRPLVLAAALLAPLGMSVAHANYAEPEHKGKHFEGDREKHEKKCDKAEKRLARAERREHHHHIKPALK